MSRKAIVIGLDNYPGAPLEGCARDARAVHKLLSRNGDENMTVNFESRIYDDSEVRTAMNLSSLITELFKGKHDAALFYFSGHGLQTSQGTDLAAPDYNKSHGVSVRFLLEAAAQSSIQTKIIILDCCYSGDAGRISKRIPDVMLSDNTIILASSRSDELSAMANKHSIFTSLLLQALEGAAAADLLGNISPEGVYALIDKSLGSFDQRPVFMANVDKFHVLRKVKPIIPIQSLQQITKYFPGQDSAYPLNPSHEPTQEKTAVPALVEIFEILQDMNRAGLVMPVGEKDMYWAAMKEKSCALTALGKHYWLLRKKDRF
jgi:hypothetical protein